MRPEAHASWGCGAMAQIWAGAPAPSSGHRKMPMKVELQGARYLKKMKSHIFKFQNNSKRIPWKHLFSLACENHLIFLYFVGCTKKKNSAKQKKLAHPKNTFWLFSVRHVWKYMVMNFHTYVIPRNTHV